jgi:DNA-binding Lrp family transcriptional regulator
MPAIVRAVKNSYHTASEISAATGIPYKTVCKRLAELKQAGVLRTTKPVDPTPQGGGDKKTLLYWLQSNWRELFKQTA